jgi:hypothetical protein
MRARYQIKLPVDRVTLHTLAAKRGVTVSRLVADAANLAARAAEPREVSREVVCTTVSLPTVMAACADDRALIEAVGRAVQDLRAHGRFRVVVPREPHPAPVARRKVPISAKDLRIVRLAAVRHGTTLSRVVSAYLAAAQADSRLRHQYDG